ncbi:MAG: DegT/DnrJ/EryC1/StrS family aminotransferase [Candidatus Methanoperedens sp.]|nr:DegT/DnrJ/EryC1/StrS family aminotransferase [Candidatus Methanoperedens sp.]
MRIIHVGDFILEKDEKSAVNEVLDSGRLSEGKKVREFELALAEFIGTKYAIAVSSGTSALIAGLTALLYSQNSPVKPGTNVITAPVTYISTSSAIVKTGLNPVFVDIDRRYFGITPESIKEHLETVDDVERYSLILPVHLMGYPCDMDGINKIAKKYGMQTFEDSAQAHGTIYKGRKTGSLSLLADFSFYIAHNIQAGELGAITTDSYDIIRLVKKIKANGRMCDCPICTRAETGCPKIKSYEGDDDFDPRFTHDMIGYNFKTMEFQAALGLSQLKKADWITRRRQENVRYLNENLEKYSDMLQLPEYLDTVSYLAYPIVINKPEKIPRKKLRTSLEKMGVETRPLFGCIPTQQPAYGYLKNEYEGRLPNAEYIGLNAFYIGCHQYLDQGDLDYMIQAFNTIMKDLR